MLCTSSGNSLKCSRGKASPLLTARGVHLNRVAYTPAFQQLQPVCKVVPSVSSSTASQRHQPCRATDPERSNSPGPGLLPTRFNSAYLAIFGAYAGLFALRNPYIFAALSILTIIPQNSTVTSLNSLVLFFYDTGLFMNFAEAVYCVRLVTWLSIGCCLVSFAVFS